MRARFLSVVAAALAAVVVAAAVPAVASALPKWHKHTLTFRDSSAYTLQVLAAIGWINDSPARITLKPAKRGHTADITFRDVNKHTTWDGRASGYRSSRGRYRVTISLNHYYFDKPEYYPVDWMKAEVITHELGHALGLNHRKGCSIMIAKGLPNECRGVEGDPVNVRCGPFRADIEALIRLYGGKISTYDAYRCVPANAPQPPLPAG